MTIQVPVTLDKPIRIVDLNGKLVQEIITHQLNFEADLSSLTKGVYLAHFLVKGQDLVKRIVIQ